MSSLLIQQLVRETGCHELEAANALEMSNNKVSESKYMIENELRFRRQRYNQPLGEAWQRYSQTDQTDYDGTISFLTDLQVDFDDEVVLAVVYELGATQQGVFDKQKWIDGWSRLSCISIGQMRHATTKMSQDLKTNSQYFANVYKNTFKYNLEPGHRLLDSETAQSYWKLLLEPRYQGVDKWLEFVSQNPGKISADTWNMYLEFCNYLQGDPQLDKYDENASWPVIIDDFVDWLRE